MTAGNAFKSAGLHGLLIWARHAPHKLTAEEVSDGFRTVDAWFERALLWDSTQGSRRARHEVLFWNMFRSGGASQIHPHMQMQLFDGPLGLEALFHDQNERYRLQFPGDDLCSLLVRVHRELGLAMSRSELDAAGCASVAACWVSLTPRVGGGELVALGHAAPAGQRPQARCLGTVVAVMYAALRSSGSEAISFGGFHITIGAGRAWLVRCWYRGTAEPCVVDAGSTELIGITSAYSDPFVLIAALRSEFIAASAGTALDVSGCPGNRSERPSQS